MNQIPNIEEEYNKCDDCGRTIKIGSVVPSDWRGNCPAGGTHQGLEKKNPQGTKVGARKSNILDHEGDYWIRCTAHEEVVNRVIETHHHQLQKARHSLHTSLVEAVEKATPVYSGKGRDDMEYGGKLMKEITLTIINSIFKE